MKTVYAPRATDDFGWLAGGCKNDLAGLDKTVGKPDRPSLRDVQMIGQMAKKLGKSMAFAFKELHPISDWDVGMSPAQRRPFVHG